MDSTFILPARVQDNADAFEKLDKTRVGVLVGTGMGGLQVFQDGVQNLVEKGYKKISPFFIPYAITNMCGADALSGKPLQCPQDRS